MEARSCHRKGRRLARRVVAAVGVGVGARALFHLDRRSLRRRASSQLAWLGGRVKGVAYHLSGRHPSTAMDDLTLADRVRSSLGPLLHRLDLPHVHVMVEDHVVLLHGEVTSREEAITIEDAVVVMPGVAGVESYLHIGLLPGDTRPSAGSESAGPSSALEALLAAARHAGAGRAASESLRATLVVFGERLPAEAREHLEAHLPRDVVALLAGARRAGRAGTPRTAAGLVAGVLEEGPAVPDERAEGIVEAILGRLRQLVPEEAVDVGAVLPEDLRRLWRGAVPL